MSIRLTLFASLLLLTVLPAWGVVIEKTDVGTLSNPLTSHGDLPGGGPDPVANPGLISRGGMIAVSSV